MAKKTFLDFEQPIAELEGKIEETWGKRGPEAGNFFLPHGITLAADGAVYVTEIDGKRIQKFVSK